MKDKLLLRLSTELKATLEEIARDLGVSTTALIRIALREYVECHKRN